VDRVLGHHETQRPHRRHHVIDPAGRVLAQPDIADRGLAHGAEFELETVAGRPGQRAPATAPVLAREPERWIVCAVLVVEPDEPGCRTVNRMADVVDQPPVAIAPGVWHLHRTAIVREERAAEFAARLLLE